jgi:hypothetical protein
MTLKEYIDSLNKFALEHPEALEFQVVQQDPEYYNYYSSEGEPKIGYFVDDSFFLTDDSSLQNAIVIY